MFFALLLETTTVKSTLPASTLSETTGETLILISLLTIRLNLIVDIFI